MKDIERQILQAFLFALAKQDKPLPESTQQQLNAFAESLNTHIADLDKFANASPDLATPYQEAHNALTAVASLRAKYVLPAEDDAGATSGEVENVIRDIQPELAPTQELLERIHQNLAQATHILSSENSVQKAQQTFKP